MVSLDNLTDQEVFQLSDLPEEVLHHISIFLSVKNIVNLSASCRRLRSVLPKFSAIILRNDSLLGPLSGNWCPLLHFDGPKLDSRVKSLKMSMTWLDHGGWGHRNGQLWIQLIRQNNILAEFLVTFGVAEHTERFAEVYVSGEKVVSMAREGDVFRFMRKLGRRGEHFLTLKHFAVRIVTYKFSESTS